MTRSDLPTGTVTFFFTDIEGSTQLMKTVGEDVFARYLGQHDRIVRSALDTHDGVEIRTEGDAFFAVFRSAKSAAAAAVDVQRSLEEQTWPDAETLRIRIGLHTGTGRLGGDNYLGLDVHRAARISDAAHGGQVLVSEPTALLLDDMGALEVVVRDIGEFKLKDIGPERLFQVEGPGLTREFPQPRSLGSTAPKLPDIATEFVGRDDEMEELSAAISPGSLVTLTGPGGTGKTRLSIAVAHRVADRFPDGAVFVGLSGTNDADLAVPTILKALDLQTSSTEIVPEEHLISFLTSRRLLLVLDNFEHVLTAKRVVARINTSCPTVAVVVTSRVPLRVAGEKEMIVAPLATTENDDHISEAAELFIRRAQTVRSGFSPDADDLAVISELVRRLDGLPLAIELAASRLTVLTPEQVLSRLDNRLLSSRTGDMPSRQQTIDATIEWSYDLLTDPARRLFVRMATFVGGAGLDEIDKVCRASDETDIDLLDNLGELIDHNLIQEVVAHGSARFSMLHVVREFAYSRLVARSEESELKGRHARIYGEIVELARTEFQTLARLKWLERLSAEHDNIRAALDWAVFKGSADDALKLVAGMWRYWQTRGPLPEAQERVMEALSIEGGDPLLRARALEAAGGIAYWRGDFDSMSAPYVEAVELMREHGGCDELALALYNLSFGLIALSDYEGAGAALDESLALAEEGDDVLGIARAHWGKFDLAWYQQETAQAQEHARLAVAGFEQVDAPFDLGWAHFAVGDTQIKMDQLEDGRRSLTTGIEVFAEAADLPALLLFLGDFAVLEYKSGNREVAGKLIGAVQAIREQIGVNLFDTVFWDQPHKEARELFGEIDDDLKVSMEVGHSLSPAEAVNLALGTG